MALQLSGDDRLPRYQRVAETIRDAVTRHEWRPGNRLPSELELSTRFRVAPGTVRQALTRLVDEGLLERRHGKGTFVRKPSFESSLFRFFRFREEGGERRVPESRILKRRRQVAPSAIADALHLPKNGEVIHISRLRLLHEEPILVEEIWLSHERFAPLLDVPCKSIGPLLYPVYEDLCDEVVARAEESLTVEVAAEDQEKLLDLPPATPVVLIERLAYGYDGRPLEWRRSRGRADGFQYHVDIR